MIKLVGVIRSIIGSFLEHNRAGRSHGPKVILAEAGGGGGGGGCGHDVEFLTIWHIVT